MRTQPDTLIRDSIAEQAASWYVACRSGDLEGREREEFVRWLRSSPLHTAEYLAISGMADDLPNASGKCQESLDELVAAARRETDIASSRNWSGRAPDLQDSEKKRGLFGVQRTYALAAGLAALAIIGVLVTVMLSPGSERYVTRHGEQRTWQLSDMSVVRLNSDSAVQLNFNRSRREITVLRGQAYFEVAKDPTRPFRVHARGATLTALGTAFDVYQHAAATVVTVTEGRVAVSSTVTQAFDKSAEERRTGGKQILLENKAVMAAELKAGEQVRISPVGKVTPIAHADIPQVIAWVRQEIAFKGETIGAVAAEFNRYNQLQIVVDDAQVAAVRISGVFQSYDVHSFTDFLEQLPGIYVKHEDENKRAIVMADRMEAY